MGFGRFGTSCAGGTHSLNGIDESVQTSESWKSHSSLAAASPCFMASCSSSVYSGLCRSSKRCRSIAWSARAYVSGASLPILTSPCPWILPLNCHSIRYHHQPPFSVLPLQIASSQTSLKPFSLCRKNQLTCCGLDWITLSTSCCGVSKGRNKNSFSAGSWLVVKM